MLILKDPVWLYNDIEYCRFIRYSKVRRTVLFTFFVKNLGNIYVFFLVDSLFGWIL